MNKWRSYQSLIVLFFLVLAIAIGFFVLYKQSNDTIAATTDQTNAFSTDTANVQHGRSLTRECIICHTMDEGGPARLGPNLFGIVGAHHAQMNGYKYSKSLADLKDRIWTPEALDKWLQSPTAYAPGTKMAFPGFIDAQERADIIAYLKTLKNR